MKEIQIEAETLAKAETTASDREAWSARTYRMIANTILPTSIKMTEDYPLNHESGHHPTLEIAMWIENGKIMLIHYSKPMASMETVLMRSAMSTSSNLSILVQEGSRRIRNCSQDLP